jgi:hypothetical protein
MSRLTDEQEEQEIPFNVSKLKVEGTEDFKEQPKVNVDEYWTSYANSKKAFSDLGFSLSAYEFEIYGPSGRKLDSNGKGTDNFFSAVDVSEEPIKQQITTLRRLKAYEYYKNKHDRQERRVREYITYDVNLEGVDHWGNIIRTRLIKQGLSFVPNVRIKITSDEHGRKQATYTYDNLRNKYYLPFSKKAVDDLLAKTNSNKDNIRYYVFVGSDPNSHITKFRCDQYTYSDFVNKTFEELESQAFAPNQKWTDEKPKKVWTG